MSARRAFNTARPIVGVTGLTVLALGVALAALADYRFPALSHLAAGVVLAACPLVLVGIVPHIGRRQS